MILPRVHSFLNRYPPHAGVDGGGVCDTMERHELLPELQGETLYGDDIEGEVL